MKKIILSTLAATTLAINMSASTLIEKPINNQIVIYSNTALITENRKVSIDKGISELVYKNISPKLITDSVSVSLPGSVSILEQNYKYDLFNLRNLLRYNVGKKVSFYINKDKTELGTGILLTAQAPFLVEVSTGEIKIISAINFVISEKPKGMITKPSLVWKIQSNKAIQDKDMEIRYLTNGISWKSDYVATIKNDKLFLNGWLTINNRSQINYNNYDLTVLAGQVNKVRNHHINKRILFKNSMISDSSMGSAPQVQEMETSGYHVYKVPFKVDIPASSKKQIQLLNKEVKNWKRVNEFKLPFVVYANKKSKLSQMIEFENEKENGVGIAIPKGVIRFYKTEPKDNKVYFIGENRIADIPNHEKVKIKIGMNFDSIIETNVIERENNNRRQYVKYSFEVRNNSKSAENYRIIQDNLIHNSRAQDIRFKQSSKSNKYTFTRLNKDKSEYTFTLAPESKIKIFVEIDGWK